MSHLIFRTTSAVTRTKGFTRFLLPSLTTTKTTTKTTTTTLQTRSYIKATIPVSGRAHKIIGAKGAKDNQKSILSAKAAKEVIEASKACNANLSDMKLKSAIMKAKKIGLAKANLEKAIARGTVEGRIKGEVDAVDIMYDGTIGTSFGKISFRVKALTNNK